MSTPPFEKHIEFNGINAHIRIPENPTGLVFIAPGAQVETNSPLISAIRDACENKNKAVVIADLGNIPIAEDEDNILNVHANFTQALNTIIDGYMLEDNSYVPEEFEIIGHSLGGAAAASVAKDYKISSLTLLDPTPLDTQTLQEVSCPTHFILSNVRQFKNTGTRMFNELEQLSDQVHTKQIVQTSSERDSGHLFTGHTREVADLIRNQPEYSDEYTIPGLDEDTLDPNENTDEHSM